MFLSFKELGSKKYFTAGDCLKTARSYHNVPGTIIKPSHFEQQPSCCFPFSSKKKKLF
jgi:hypothetical protein